MLELELVVLTTFIIQQGGKHAHMMMLCQIIVGGSLHQREHTPFPSQSRTCSGVEAQC